MAELTPTKPSSPTIWLQESMRTAVILWAVVSMAVAVLMDREGLASFILWAVGIWMLGIIPVLMASAGVGGLIATLAGGGLGRGHLTLVFAALSVTAPILVVPKGLPFVLGLNVNGWLLAVMVGVSLAAFTGSLLGAIELRARMRDARWLHIQHTRIAIPVCLVLVSLPLISFAGEFDAATAGGAHATSYHQALAPILLTMATGGTLVGWWRAPRVVAEYWKNEEEQ